VATRGLPAGAKDRLFFTVMGAAVAVTVFAGFARSYYLSHWLTPPARTPEITPLLHLHATVFTLWILLQVVQPALIASGRAAVHRGLGWFGVALALGVWLLGNLASIEAMKAGYKGLGNPYAFYAITFFSMQAFGIIIALGIIRRNEADAHKRLMLLSSASILDTAPLSFYLGADLIILAGILYDWRSRGRVHGVWLWGGGALIASQALRVAIMNTEPWLAFAHALARIT
jgi:hypothetical protein